MNITRRRAITVLSAAAIGRALGDDSAAVTSEKPYGCALGASTYGLPKQSLTEAIQMIRSCGYTAIEICVTPDRDAAAEKTSFRQRRDVRRQLEASRLDLTSLMSNLRPLESAQRHHDDLERLKHDCDLAHDLRPGKPPVIQTVLGGSDWNEVKNLCVERLADWVDVAERREAVIAVKPHRGHAMSRPSEAIWLASQLGNPPQLKMWFDYSHFLFRNMPMEQTVTESLPILAGVAVKDAFQVDGTVKFALPGQAGTIDYKTLCKLLYGGGYRGVFCVEVSSQVWKQPDYDPKRALKDSYAEMKVAMRRAGVPRRY